MTRVCTRPYAVAAAVLMLVGCQVEKSANPLSPAIAGPVAGVVITTPNLLEPGQSWEMKARDQPIQLLIQNADTSGVRPLKYSFDIASDANFAKVVFARTGVAPGADGLTRLQLPDKLAPGTYWWRTRAEDGANTGAYSAVKSFQVLAQVVLGAPTPTAPGNGSSLGNLVPEFKVKAGDRSGVTADLEYTLQVSTSSAFTSVAATFIQKETWPETRIAQGYSFLNSKTYYWRVRATHTADASDQSNWSAVWSFRTPEPPAAPAPGPGPSPSPGGGGANCSSSNGPDIAACIESRYPQYLAAGVSLSQRYANMEFLRDRLIEHAKCRGLDVGWNLKRGGPEVSRDFVAWRNGAILEGVDIASAYDDTGRTLRLSWHRYGPPDYGYPFYKSYGAAKCS